MATYEWTIVEHMPLHILKCGQWKAPLQEKALFLIIPGNPGNMGFYETFAESLFLETGIPVWGISHTGHVTTPEKIEDQMPVQHPMPQDCGLQLQINHKMQFIKQKVLPNVDKVFLIGHSIGCYIILHILDKMNDSKLVKGIMLFPTIERMAVSPKGKWLTPILVHARGVISVLAWVLNYLPLFLKKGLVKLLFKSTNEASRQAVLYDIISPKVASSCSYMAMQEMLSVDQRDDDIIKHQSAKLHFYYGAIDAWCPVSYYYDMKRCFSNMDIRLCQHNYRHAFVLNESEQVALIVADMVKQF